jgi:high-affinity nickel permease
LVLASLHICSVWRHAFGADHIAAIDDTVRFMLQREIGRSTWGSLSRWAIPQSSWAWPSSLPFAASAVMRDLPQLRDVGEVIGVCISGVFLWVIGIINLLVLLDLLKVWQQVKSGTHDHQHLEALLLRRGLLNRLFRGRLQKLMNHSWQMYPPGLLFGLGFDTASEVALLYDRRRLRGKSTNPCGALAAYPFCGGNDAYGRNRRRVDVEGLRLRVPQSRAKGFLQRHDHGASASMLPPPMNAAWPLHAKRPQHGPHPLAAR